MAPGHVIMFRKWWVVLLWLAGFLSASCAWKSQYKAPSKTKWNGIARLGDLKGSVCLRVQGKQNFHVYPLGFIPGFSAVEIVAPVAAPTNPKGLGQIAVFPENHLWSEIYPGFKGLSEKDKSELSLFYPVRIFKNKELSGAKQADCQGVQPIAVYQLELSILLVQQTYGWSLFGIFYLPFDDEHFLIQSTARFRCPSSQQVRESVRHFRFVNIGSPKADKHPVEFSGVHLPVSAGIYAQAHLVELLDVCGWPGNDSPEM